MCVCVCVCVCVCSYCRSGGEDDELTAATDMTICGGEQTKRPSIQPTVTLLRRFTHQVHLDGAHSRLGRRRRHAVVCFELLDGRTALKDQPLVPNLTGLGELARGISKGDTRDGGGGSEMRTAVREQLELRVFSSKSRPLSTS